ncbi:pilus assembly protein PilM [bacterium]|nr:pilus assembly protein PilM [bacterium]
MAQNIVGIDIGSHSIKVCEVTRQKGEFEVVRFVEHVINQQNNRLTYEEAVSAGLRHIFEKNEFTTDVISASLPAHLVSTRIIELPFTNAKKIEQTLEFELESYVPLPMEDLMVDYHMLSSQNGRSTVLCTYVPRVRFVKFLDMFQIAGLDPKYVGVDMVDLSFIANAAMVPDNTLYAMVDIGHKKTNICIMDGNKLAYARTITIGGLNFTRAIQKAFRLNQDKAESLKMDRGKVSNREDELDQISLLCQKVAEELIVAIRQTYLGFGQVYPKREWGGLYLCGGGSKLPGLVDVLSSALRMNVTTLDSLEYVSHKLSHADEVKDIIPLSLAQSLRVIYPIRGATINYRTGEFSYKKDIKALGGEIKQLGVWVFVLFLLGAFYFGFSYYTWQSRTQTMNASLVKAAIKLLPKELKGQEKSDVAKLLTIVNGRVNELKPQLEAIRALKEGPSPLEILLEVSSKFPPKEDVAIDVDKFNIIDNQVRLEGRTVSFEAVDKMKELLATSSLFANISTIRVEKGLRDEIRFSLSMDIKVGEEPPTPKTEPEGKKTAQKGDEE